MKNHRFYAAPYLLVALSAFLVAGPGWSQDAARSVPGEAVGEEQFGGWAEPAFEEDDLGMTDEQKAKIRALRQEFRKERVRARAELRIQRMELADLMRAENPDRAAIARKLKENSEARNAQMLTRFDHRQEIRSLLTPEQQAKMKEMRKERRGRHRMGRQGRRGRRGRDGGRGFRGRRGFRGGEDCPCRMGPGGGEQGPGHGQDKEGADNDSGDSPVE